MVRWQSDMRLVIVGSGALGSIFAAHLAPFTNLVMLGHWTAQMSILRSQGLTMINLGGSRSHHTFSTTDKSLSIEATDIALVLVKSYQTERAAGEIKQFLAEDGLAISLQNGLSNVDALANVLGSARVTQGVTALGATMIEPGLVRFAGRGPTYLPFSQRSSKPVAQLSQWMNQAGMETSFANNLKSLVWGKLAINAGINALTALLRVPNGFLASNAQARQLMCAAAEETADVARALDIELPYSDVAKRVIEVAQATAENRSSMLQDVLRGSQTEIDFINGAVVRFGQSNEVPTPINNELYRLVSILPIPDPETPLAGKLDSLKSLL
ncbi:MAG: 2-dehydropantoate 2-reductase [Anaerolineaceae bacterium]|nr:MAG: 2-dehydropantoate 2-reductase [Anaerolineaceae bacterium]